MPAAWWHQLPNSPVFSCCANQHHLGTKLPVDTSRSSPDLDCADSFVAFIAIISTFAPPIPYYDHAPAGPGRTDLPHRQVWRLGPQLVTPASAVRGENGERGDDEDLPGARHGLGVGGAMYEVAAAASDHEARNQNTGQEYRVYGRQQLVRVQLLYIFISPIYSLVSNL